MVFDNTILVGVCIVLILLVVHANFENMIYKYVDVSRVDMNSLRAGDIIFMKYCEKCKFTGNILNDAWISSYRRLFNTFRYYVTAQHYTHVAIVLNIKGKPSITHIDYDTMYDSHTGRRQTGKVLVSPWNHLNIRGGVIHVYKYLGKSFPEDSTYWINYNNNTTYPSLPNLVFTNALKLKSHPDDIMACTDYVEHTLKNYNIIDSCTNNSTLTDVYDIAMSNKNYESVPRIVKNICTLNGHY